MSLEAHLRIAFEQMSDDGTGNTALDGLVAQSGHLADRDFVAISSALWVNLLIVGAIATGLESISRPVVHCF